MGKNNALTRFFCIGKKLPVINNYSEPMENQEKYANILCEMVRFKTIDGNKSQFDDYYQKLKELFPTFFRVAKKIDIEEAYLFKIKGQTQGLPNLLLAHSDVVEAEGEWEYPPFAGVIAENKIWGRGTLDNKCMFASILIALEEMLNEGFVPNTDLYILSTMCEETTSNGVNNAGDYFDKEGLIFDTILDEGGAITCDAMPGVKNDLALIGLCEKGFLDVKFTIKCSGGHSSSPTSNNPIGRLSKLIQYFETKKVFKAKFIPTFKTTFTTIAPYMTMPLRMVLGNIWLFGGLLKKILPKMNATIGAMMKTTMVFTRVSGSDSNNVIPETAWAIANLRPLNGESVDEILAKLNNVADKFGAEVEVLYHQEAGEVTAHDSQIVSQISEIISQLMPSTITVPYMIVGGTDAGKLNRFSKQTIGFSPIRASYEQVSAMHGKNENIGIVEFAKAIEFFKKLIALK